jgi:hypothetical protein
MSRVISVGAAMLLLGILMGMGIALPVALMSTQRAATTIIKQKVPNLPIVP